MTAAPLKLFFVLPFAPDLRGIHGGSRATAAIVAMLSQHHQVHVLYLSRASDADPRQLPSGCVHIEAVDVEAGTTSKRSPAARLGRKLGRLLWRNPRWVDDSWSERLAARAAEIAQRVQPDVVHYEFHVMAQYLPLIRANCPDALHIVTEHEPGVKADDRTGGSATRVEKATGWAKSLAWARFERRVLPKSDGIIVFTESDAAKLAQLLGSDAPPIAVIPFRLPAAGPVSDANPAPVQSDFLFVGNFRHPPNVDAALRLVRNIFPLVQQDLPGATLKIVGAHPPPELIAAGSDQVEITGWVDDPAVYLAGAAVMVMPLRQGGGLRVKMLEACAAGKAVVASALAVEGLELTDQREFVLAETDAEFARAAVSLSSDSKRRKRLESASRKWFEQEQSEERWAEQYANFYAALFVRRRGKSL